MQWIDWQTFFQEFFKPLQAITTFHHFNVVKSEPGVVTVREYADSTEEKVKKGTNATSLRGKRPNSITPKGLDAKRQWYLYDEIRDFCSSNLAKDRTCPLPSVPRPPKEAQTKRSKK